jgi:hypothetical protein
VSFAVALFCTKHRMSMRGAWLLVVGWGGYLFIELLVVANEYVLGRLLGYEVTRWITALLLLVTAAGIGLIPRSLRRLG